MLVVILRKRTQRGEAKGEPHKHICVGGWEEGRQLVLRPNC